MQYKFAKVDKQTENDKTPGYALFAFENNILHIFLKCFFQVLAGKIPNSIAFPPSLEEAHIQETVFFNLFPYAGVRLTHTYKIKLLSYFNTFSVMHSGPSKVVTSYCFI